MEWYWWIIIGLGVLALGIIKIKVGGKYLAKKKQEKEELEKMRDKEE